MLRRSTDEEIEQIRKLWWEGESINVITILLGKDRSTVRWHIKKNGMERDPTIQVTKNNRRLKPKDLYGTSIPAKQYRDYVVDDTIRSFYHSSGERRCADCKLLFLLSQFSSEDPHTCNDCRVGRNRMIEVHVIRRRSKTNRR